MLGKRSISLLTSAVPSWVKMPFVHWQFFKASSDHTVDRTNRRSGINSRSKITFPDPEVAPISEHNKMKEKTPFPIVDQATIRRPQWKERKKPLHIVDQATTRRSSSFVLPEETCPCRRRFWMNAQEIWLFKILSKDVRTRFAKICCLVVLVAHGTAASVILNTNISLYHSFTVRIIYSSKKANLEEDLAFKQSQRGKVHIL